MTTHGRRNGCCGPDGTDGPNLACAFCRAEIATESADCWTWQQVSLQPGAVECVTLPPTGNQSSAGGASRTPER